jgi:hypothetical protein
MPGVNVMVLENCGKNIHNTCFFKKIAKLLLFLFKIGHNRQKYVVVVTLAPAENLAL